MPEKTVLQSQLEDKEVLESLKRSGQLERIARHAERALPSGMAESVDFGGRGLETAMERLEAGDIDQGNAAEAIIMVTGYPSLLIRNGDYEEPPEEVWRGRLNPSRQAIKDVIRSVGRVELKNHPERIPWVGTCWLVDEDILITNRHVAHAFSELRQNRWEFMRGVEVNVDFAEEIGGREPLELLIGSLEYFEPLTGPADLALMRLAPGAARQLRLSPLALDMRLADVEFLGVVGYPARDLRNNPRDAFNRIFQGQFGVKRLAPGKVMNASLSAETFTHNCTTLGGNSGSVVFNVANGAAIGLHFGGIPQEQNYAVKAETIAARMRSRSIAVRQPAGNRGRRDGGGSQEVRARPEDFAGRDGYQPDFLGKGALSVPLPRLSPAQLRNVAKMKGGGIVLDYRHFSAVINKQRRLAYVSAANVDGEKLRVPRRTSRFMLDPRLPDDSQTGEDMYRDNPFDRGHLVRRLDPCWGEDEEVAQANRDSFFFPNIAPQHKELNQKIWNDLEEHILSTTDDQDARVSVLVGCVFDEEDPVQKPSGIKVPMAFWKVVASLGRDGRGRRRNGMPKLQAQAFVMSQQKLVRPGDLEIVFGEGFETFQVTVEQLERMTGLDFHKLRDADTFSMSDDEREGVITESNLERASDPKFSGHFKALKSVHDIVL